MEKLMTGTGSAGSLYTGGMSVDAVAKHLGTTYGQAKKAILAEGATLRNTSDRLKGRTRVKKAEVDVSTSHTPVQGSTHIHADV